MSESQFGRKTKLSMIPGATHVRAISIVIASCSLNLILAVSTLTENKIATF